jgi:hypothetical protein
MTKRHFPLVKLPSSVDLTLFLIREELKANRFFTGLYRLSLCDCFYQPHLGSAILSHLGFDNCPDDLFAFYTNLIDKHSEVLEEDMQSLTTHALEVYHELVSEQRRRMPPDK